MVRRVQSSLDPPRQKQQCYAAEAAEKMRQLQERERHDGGDPFQPRRKLGCRAGEEQQRSCCEYDNGKDAGSYGGHTLAHDPSDKRDL